jgi:hypothetical protein
MAGKARYHGVSEAFDHCPEYLAAAVKGVEGIWPCPEDFMCKKIRRQASFCNLPKMLDKKRRKFYPYMKQEHE